MKELNINNEKVVIRKTDKSDAKALVEYMNYIGSESDFLSFGAGQFGMSAEQEEEYIETVLKKNNALSIIAEVNGKVVGNLTFNAGNRQRTEHTGEFGISVSKAYWGYGIGEEFIKYMINWSKGSGIIRKINLRTRSDNERAIKLYKKLGFTEEGIIKRDICISGKFYDSLLMGMLID
ncbi:MULTISPECIES: GNAT family N-acetyltransferase [unclassified Sedimentibacter]|uniref:GNAT family N-acetyltransferase n=1 Tax=unclassified Sedimentibacter TaxID=2649220 RepID=UPI0027E077A6|nr:GNAT family protein [Sedimentibacter sp. MB35-C1]WMJ76204.1 GNAT family protein [Sedimentibacter sp. MB35-C1]